MLYGRLPTTRSSARRARAGRRREIDLEHVGLDDVEAGRAAQPRRQVAIELDHRERAAALEQRPRQGAAGPGPISTSASPGRGSIAATIALDHRAIDEEVLAEALSRAMRAQALAPRVPPLLRRVAQLDVGAAAQVAQPFVVGLLELLLAQDVARLLALLLACRA